MQFISLRDKKSEFKFEVGDLLITNKLEGMGMFISEKTLFQIVGSIKNENDVFKLKYISGYHDTYFRTITENMGNWVIHYSKEFSDRLDYYEMVDGFALSNNYYKLCKFFFRPTEEEKYEMFSL